LNDPGVDSLLNTDDVVMAIDCPVWMANASYWSGSDPKYVAILSPWAAWR